MAVIKVTDIAYVRLRSPDLDLKAEFLDNFGLIPSSKSAKALYYRGTDPVHHLHITEKGDPKFVAVAYHAASEDDLKTIAKRSKEFEAAVKTGNHLGMSEANKRFHMAIADAGRNPYLASFYEKLLSQGQRMLHLHFEYLERTHEGYLLTDEHNLMLEAIRAKDVERADDLAHAHTRQFQNNFIEFMRENYTTDVTLRSLTAAE